MSLLDSVFHTRFVGRVALSASYFWRTRSATYRKRDSAFIASPWTLLSAVGNHASSRLSTSSETLRRPLLASLETGFVYSNIRCATCFFILLRAGKNLVGYAN